MWKRISKAGKVVYCERYTNPMTGKKRDISVTYPKDTAANRKEAGLILAKRLEKLQEEAFFPETKNLRFGELIGLYLKDLKKSVKESTYIRNRFAANKLVQIIGGDVYVGRMTAAYVRKAFLDTGKGGGTLNEFLKRFKAIIRWGYKSDLIDSTAFLEKLDPFPDVPRREKISDKFLEAEDLRKVIEAAKPPLWKLLIQFLSLSGLRIGEAMALTLEDIDHEKKVIHITKTYNFKCDITTTPKTAASEGELYMQPELEAVVKAARSFGLRQALSEGFRSDLLFPGPDGCHLNYGSFNKFFRELTDRVIGRPLGPHALRHTHASLLFEQGFSLDEVARRLRHGNSRVTREIYIHVTEKLKEKDAKKLDAVTLLS